MNTNYRQAKYYTSQQCTTANAPDLSRFIQTYPLDSQLFLESYSFEAQDHFAYILLNNINNGTFLDIGCQYPIRGSNTHLFDVDLGWHGIAFDKDTSAYAGAYNWETTRSERTTFVQLDARTEEFTTYLKYHISDVVDYISLDNDMVQDGCHDNIGDVSLSRLVHSGVSFKVMTLEHEFYLIGDKVRAFSRQLLHNLGYRMLFEDVCLPDNKAFEDWWINPQYFSSNIFNYGGKNLLWEECIKKIKESIV